MVVIISRKLNGPGHRGRHLDDYPTYLCATLMELHLLEIETAICSTPLASAIQLLPVLSFYFALLCHLHESLDGEKGSDGV